MYERLKDTIYRSDYIWYLKHLDIDSNEIFFSNLSIGHAPVN